MTGPPDPSPFPPSPFANGAPASPLPPGTTVAVTKLNPLGEAVTTYAATVVDVGAPAPWLALEARWTFRVVETHGLAFHPGDRLVEYFSPDHPYDAFAVFAPDGALRGWYANVTHPTMFDPRRDPPSVVWHDLYLDVVMLPGGEPVLLDEDELDASGLRARDPRLDGRIRAAADQLLGLARAGRFPFDTGHRDQWASPDGDGETGRASTT